MIESTSSVRGGGPFTDETIQTNGDRKLARRTWRYPSGQIGRVRLYIEQPRGRPGCVTRSWFDSPSAAARALRRGREPCCRKRSPAVLVPEGDPGRSRLAEARLVLGANLERLAVVKCLSE